MCTQNKPTNLIEEAEALAKYVARRGDSLPEGKTKFFENLLEAIKNAKSNPSKCHCQCLMKAYAKITAVTYKERGVNGRTILDTQAKSCMWSRAWLSAPKNRPGLIGVGFFIAAMIFEALARWSGSVSDPKEFILGTFCYHLIGTFSTFLVPAVWGGIGGCVFLMKRLSDKLVDLAYEKARQRGGRHSDHSWFHAWSRHRGAVFPRFR